MAGFEARVQRQRAGTTDALRQTVNDVARIRPSTQAEITERRVIAEEQFRDLGLLDYLNDALNFIKYRDGHRDAQLVFDWHEPQSDLDRELTRIKRRISPEASLLLDILGPSRVLTPAAQEKILEKINGSAIAEFRFDTVDGEAAVGYSFVRVQYFPMKGIAEVTGSDKKIVWAYSEGLEPVEEAIVAAYGNPGTVAPLHQHAENEIATPPAPKTPPPDSSPDLDHWKLS